MLEQFRYLVRRLLDAIEHIERESVTGQVERLQKPGAPHTEVIGVTLLACIVLTALEFYGGSNDWTWLEDAASLAGSDWAAAVGHFFDDGKYSRLHELAYWSACTFVGYMAVPMLWTKVAMGRSLQETGLSGRGFVSHAWIYGVLFALVLPIVYAISGTESFQNTYPFYRHAGRSVYDFVAWELLYALQFMSLEFFFRGFLVHGLKRRFGFYSIFVAVIPYCMIHFGKPIPEALGSIVAGLTLGLFSLLTGSIWLGVLIHVSVAISMDVFALGF